MSKTTAEVLKKAKLDPDKERLVQALYCACGINYYVGGYPRCLEEKSWVREMLKCMRSGGSVRIFCVDDEPNMLYVGTCTCGYVKACAPKKKAIRSENSRKD